MDIGAGLSLSKGQQATIKAIIKKAQWSYTLRKLLSIDEFLPAHCAVGKKGSKNLPIPHNQMGSLKGTCVNMHARYM